MKNILLLLLVSMGFCNCKEKKQEIVFSALKESGFNAERFALPKGNLPDSLKQAHDNCMGFSFDANAGFLQTKDSFFIGCIVNRKSLITLSSINDLGLSPARIFTDFNIIANPCYEKRVLQFPVRSLLGKEFNLQFPAATAILNREINDAIAAAPAAEMQTGSWMYLDMKDMLKKMLDSTKTPALLQYKKNLLDSNNMVLTTVEGVTDVSFIINTKGDLSTPLQAFLKTSPTLTTAPGNTSLKLLYADKNKFGIYFSGFFPVAGMFMKAAVQ